MEKKRKSRYLVYGVLVVLGIFSFMAFISLVRPFPIAGAKVTYAKVTLIYLDIINSAGKRIMDGKMVCTNTGRQFVPASSFGIKTHKLSTGVYFLRLNIDKETLCQPFVCW